jgi:hypothetical protein
MIDDVEADFKERKEAVIAIKIGLKGLTTCLP